MIRDQPPRPANMRVVVAINQGRIPVSFAEPDPPEIDARAARARLDAGELALDVRPWGAFDAAHLPGAFHVSATSASFEQYVGWIVPEAGPVILVAEDGAAARAAARKLAFVGLDRRVVAWLPWRSWAAAGLAVDSTPHVEVGELRDALARGALDLLDVRERDEFDAGHAAGAIHVNFKHLPAELDRLEAGRERPLAVACAGGLRSAIAAAVLRRAGWTDVRSVEGGMGAWVRAGLPVVVGSTPG